MRFEAREVPPYGEPVTSSELRVGTVYYFLHFADADAQIPELQPVIFIGKNLEPTDTARVYFQDAGSYIARARYGSSGSQSPSFFTGSENQLGHVFDFEHALDRLLDCSLRRRSGTP